jgi:hypothetical protein
MQQSVWDLQQHGAPSALCTLQSVMPLKERLQLASPPTSLTQRYAGGHSAPKTASPHCRSCNCACTHDLSPPPTFMHSHLPAGRCTECHIIMNMAAMAAMKWQQ